MHPVIRVVTFFVFSFSMAFGHALHLALAAVLLVVAHERLADLAHVRSLLVFGRHEFRAASRGR